MRSKMINGCGPYYYEVKSVREGKHVRQKVIRYIGKHPDAPEIGGDSAKARPAPSGHLELEPGTAKARKEPKKWSRLRLERARKISEATGCNRLQADALAKTALRMDIDPDTYDWDQLQGKDLSYDERLRKMGTGSWRIQATTEEEYELEYEEYLDKHGLKDESSKQWKPSQWKEEYQKHVKEDEYTDWEGPYIKGVEDD